MKGFWSNKRVTVTGGAGFLGQHLVKRLESFGAEVYVPRQRDYNLTTLDACLRCVLEHPCDVLFHAAAYYGGIGINQTQPATLYYTNLVMGANLMEAARLAEGQEVRRHRHGVQLSRLPRRPPQGRRPLGRPLPRQRRQLRPDQEDDGRAGAGVQAAVRARLDPPDPDEPLRARRLVQPRAVARRRGPGAEVGRGRAWPRRPSVEVWGTGKPVREFIYVEDCADAIVLAAEKYDDAAMPLNIGTGIGTSIKELAETVHEVSGYKGKMTWNADKPDGAAIKVLDVTRMKEVLDGWTPPTKLRDGLAKTVAWYRANKAQADAKW